MTRARTRIIGSGSWVPDLVVGNDKLAQLVDTSDDWIRTRSGIRERRLLEFANLSGPNDMPGTSQMALHAAREALARAGKKPEDLDLIVVGTVTPDLRCPSCAVLVQQKLGAKNAAAFDVVAACAGSLFSLSVVDKFIRSGTARCALVIGAETLSTITNWKDRSTCVLFGDAAGALVVEAGPDEVGASGVIDTAIYTDGEHWKHIHIPAGGSRQRMTQELLDQQADRLVMNGREVFKFAVRALVDAAKGILERNGLKPSDVACVVAHQANLRIIEAIADRVAIPMDRFVINIDRYGNTSSASCMLTYDEAVRTGRAKPGDVVLMLAIGAGMAWSSALVRV